MRRHLALAGMVLAVTPAWAFDANKLGQGGSLPLSDLGGLINQSAKLRGEVNAALAKSKRTADSVVCGGNRFPREWLHLGAARAAPYACNFNGKWLVIDATVTVSGRNGRIYDAITPAAMHDADKITETRPTWKWTDKAPD